ncbi:hypothetical protein QTI17_34265 [Variovorax sp. J31P179]|uniref:hypothetical protein n=1 Tax=Variovorax sp. J31P179 TaxID=3053508 RepID=UPI002577F3F2|nr:hypothetical protein [Variovorax sp. J31P179]MDM0085657.1 hypothetical protein [Variovorax sp. J31P179]
MHSNDNTPCALQARFLYMFPLEGEDRRRAYVSFHGWLPAVANTCADIDALLGADKRGFRWTRLREKFGSPSFAYRMEGKGRVATLIHRPTEVHRQEVGSNEPVDSLVFAINELVLQVELKLRSSCIVCGAPSEINNDRGPGRRSASCTAWKTMGLKGTWVLFGRPLK